MDRVGAATSHSFREKLVEKALRALKAFFGGIRLEYLPVLLVYFAFGAAGITSVAATFWIKKHLNLGPEALAAISFWIAYPPNRGSGCPSRDAGNSYNRFENFGKGTRSNVERSTGNFHTGFGTA